MMLNDNKTWGLGTDKNPAGLNDCFYHWVNSKLVKPVNRQYIFWLHFTIGVYLDLDSCGPVYLLMTSRINETRQSTHMHQPRWLCWFSYIHKLPSAGNFSGSMRSTKHNATISLPVMRLCIIEQSFSEGSLQTSRNVLTIWRWTFEILTDLTFKGILCAVSTINLGKNHEFPAQMFHPC